MKRIFIVLRLLLVVVFCFIILMPSFVFSEELFKLKWKKEIKEFCYINNPWISNPLIFGKYLLYPSTCGVYLFDQNGTLLWNFEKKDNVIGVVAGPDLIVVGGEEGVGFDYGKYVYALSWDGKVLWKFKIEGTISSYPVLGDLNGDGNLDVVIVINTHEPFDYYIYAISGKDGKLLWKFKTNSLGSSFPALGDFNRDGYLDVIIRVFLMDENYIYVLSGKEGRLLQKFKIGIGAISYPVLGDINKDGHLDVVVGQAFSIYAFSGKNKRLLWKFETMPTISIASFLPALGDLNRDGYLDVVVGHKDINYIYAVSGKMERFCGSLKPVGLVFTLLCLETLTEMGI